MNEPNQPQQPNRPSSDGVGQAFLLFAISLILVLTIGSAVQLMSVRLGLVITELVLILLPATLFVRWKRLPIAEALRWRVVTPTTTLLSVAVGVTAWGVAVGIHVLSRPVLGDPPEFAALEAETPAQLAIILFCAALLPGLCEETLFRGAIQGMLRRRGPRKAVLITAFLFAIYHVNPWILVPTFFLGVVFGTLVVRTGSTVPAILSHIASNAMAFTVPYLYRDHPDSATYPLIGVLAAAFCVTFPIFWISTRGGKPAQPILATVPTGVARPLIWVASLVAGAGALLVIAAVGAALTLVDVHTMTGDALEPEIEQGDKLIVLQAGMLELDLEEGDIISYRRDGKTVLRRVLRIEGDRLWIRDGSSELEIPRRAIIGKVVHTIKQEGSADI